MEYPDDTTMRIFHETIYCHIYCLPKGELKKELMRGLRRKCRQRYLRRYLHDRKSRIPDAISIDERPKEVNSRQVPGHWEGDLVMGKERKSAIGTLAERTTRPTLLVPLNARMRPASALLLQKRSSAYLRVMSRYYSFKGEAG